MKYHEPLRPEHFYHIFNHAVGSENLFRETTNYTYFLELVIRHVVPIVDVYAYNLLPNHFHMMVRIKPIEELKNVYSIKYEKEANENTDWEKFVMQQFSNMFNAYAKAYNKKYMRRGALFIDYMKRVQITNSKYFCNCLHYIHYNAILHKLCYQIDEWRWTSYHSILTNAKTNIDRNVVMNNFNGKEQFIDFHKSKPTVYGEEWEFGYI